MPPTRGRNTRGRNTRGRNRRGNYPQNGARVITHAYKTYPLNITYRALPRAHVTIPKESTLAKANFIPKNGIPKNAKNVLSKYGIDASILKRDGTKISLHKNGSPIVDLDDGITVYILFDDSTYALPYIYNEDVGYTSDPNLDDDITNNMDDIYPITLYYSQTNFSDIEVYIYNNKQRRNFITPRFNVENV